METETAEVTNGKGQIYGLLAQILKEVGPVGKGRSNVQQGYKFRGIDDVYEAVHPLFAEHGVFTVPRILNEHTTERTTASGTVLRFVNVTMAYDFFASDGSFVTAEMIGEAMDAGDKASNKAMSAAHKYALIQTLCIPTGSTPDADYTTHPEITDTVREVSNNSMPVQMCPDCNGPMWDNRETKKGKQPDYKCKDKSCNKAIWLDSVKSVEKKLLTQALVDACKVLNQAGDSIEWTPKTAGAYASEHYGKNIDALNEDEIQSMLKMLSDRMDGLKTNQRPNLISSITSNFDTKEQLLTYLKDAWKGKALEDMSIAELETVDKDITVPF